MVCANLFIVIFRRLFLLVTLNAEVIIDNVLILWNPNEKNVVIIIRNVFLNWIYYAT